MAVELRCMSRPCGRMNVLRLLLPTDGSKLTNANNLVDSCIVVPPGMAIVWPGPFAWAWFAR